MRRSVKIRIIFMAILLTFGVFVCAVRQAERLGRYEYDWTNQINRAIVQ